MKRLISNSANDTSKNLGPGAYNVSDELTRHSPRSNIKFGVSKTVRVDPFSAKTKNTMPSVGPGSYEYWSKTLGGHKIPNPTIPRESSNRSSLHPGVRLRGGKKPRNASIRENFEEYSDEDSEGGSVSGISVPGPGSYIKDFSTFGKSTAKSESF
jgi:hypothetical protein